MKKSGMRKGRANSTTVPIQPVAPAAASTPSVECIMTTMQMQKPLATSTQSTRVVPIGMAGTPQEKSARARLMCLEFRRCRPIR